MMGLVRSVLTTEWGGKCIHAYEAVESVSSRLALGHSDHARTMHFLR